MRGEALICATAITITALLFGGIYQHASGSSGPLYVINRFTVWFCAYRAIEKVTRPFVRTTRSA
jgi:hypothetical protein